MVDYKGYVKAERSKEEYDNLENAYMYEGGKMNYQLNRIQAIFFDNLKQIFNTYHTFLEKLEKEKSSNLQEINKKLEHSKQVSDFPQISLLESQKKAIEERHKIYIKDLETSLENYMQKLPESPITLPIKTKIIFEKRKVLIDHIMVMPTDSGEKFYEFFTNYFKNIADEITDYAPDSHFCIIKFENSVENVIRIDRYTKLLSTGMISGDVVYFRGDVILKSEGKKNCFKTDFDKSKQNIVKYFSCENCNLNCKDILILRDM